MEQPPVQVDYRMQFLGSFVQKTLKLKPEKWTRMMSTEEHKAVVMKFLERPFPITLIIVLTPAAQLVAFNSFPLPQLKNKGGFSNNYRSIKIHLFIIIINMKMSLY